MTEIDFCGWCKYNQHRCEAQHAKKCDFASLKPTKVAILRRAKSEYEVIAKMREELKTCKNNERIEELLMETRDKSEGIKIMMERLEAEFGVSKLKFIEEVGIETPKFSEQVRLMSKIKELENKRRGGTKNGY